jgi:uncharacterized membrane protein YkvA (DUF1232 family)
MHEISQILEHIPREWRANYQALIPASQPNLVGLRAELDRYMDSCRSLAQSVEFFDLERASQTYEACLALLEHLKRDSAPWRAVAAAVNYFIAEDDAIGDSTLIGFDDDWQVVSATCEVLGVQPGGS